MKKILYCTLLAFVASAVAFVGCKEDDDVSLPPIGGFNSSDEVGAADLLAHFPCEDGSEHISKAAPAESKNATYEAGFKGKSLNLKAGYVAYNPIAALTTNTTSYTMSAWIKVKNNKSSATMVASLTRPNEWAGNFNLMLETGWYNAVSDTLVVKGLLISREGSPAVDSWQDSRNDPPKGGDQAFKGAGDTWTHCVVTWDATASKFLVYANGKKISNPEWEERKHNGNPVGDLVFNSAASRLVLGAFNTNTATGGGTPEAWQVPMTGGIDEVRIWKKSLSAAEIDALYQLEKAGR